MENRESVKTYQTSEVAKIIGVHPNTIRLYEEYGLIPVPKRRDNGYRIFTDRHIKHLEIARALLSIEILHDGLRKTAIQIIKHSASENFELALSLTYEYLHRLREDEHEAKQAINIVNQILSGAEEFKDPNPASYPMLRKETAEYLNVTIDTLRNWELNGLLKVKRRSNGYRVYNAEDIQKLRIIRVLRNANYSLAAILRMLNALSSDPQIDIMEVIDTPGENEDIISVCDRLLSSIHSAEEKALLVIQILQELEPG